MSEITCHTCGHTHPRKPTREERRRELLEEEQDLLGALEKISEELKALETESLIGGEDGVCS